jgi:hypothetical protein
MLAEIQAAVRNRRLALLDELGVEPTLWLAAPPLWTRAVASAAGFPVGDVLGFIKRACDANWCKTEGPLLDDDPDLTFWMPDEVRRDVIDLIRHDRSSQLRPRSSYGADSGLADVGRIASAMLRAREEDVPGALAAWARLMVEPATAPAVLVDRVALLVANLDLSGAQDLVIAGEAISAVVGGTADIALGRARRLLSLGLRRRQDERALGKYLNRPELSNAVDRLLAPDAAQWALHLRGVGGVGKTMQIRYLASGRYARERRRSPIPVTRVDFDHMRPDYPVRRPVQLLVELADELSLHTAGVERADRQMADFHARATRAHEAVSGLREAIGSPLDNAEVGSAIDSFGAVLDQLGKEHGGVLLILDTCEELAKADMGNPAAPAVRATFTILERLHQRAPSLRVLFAGRRPLLEKDYLTVQPVAGFTAEEARRYLAMSSAQPLDVELADAMIRQSPAVELPRDPASDQPREERVNPFDLALYAAWADEDPDLTAAQVDAGSDAYIEGRIIERLGDPLVKRALPLLATAGRGRVETLASCLDADRAFVGRRLAVQEWIAAEGDPTTFVTASPALARRLRRYFLADERRAAFEAETRRLADHLRAQMLNRPLADIDVDELIAALRLSPAAEAAGLWDSIADRAMQPPGHWATVGTMTRRILGEWEEEEWPTTAALRAAVMAAHIAAARRDSPAFDPRPWWEMVRDWAGQHPDPETRQVLATRAALGLLGGSFAELKIPPQLRSQSLSAAAADALYRLLERGQRAAAEVLYRDLAEASMPGTHRIHAWLRVGRARLRAGDDPPEAQRSSLEAAAWQLKQAAMAEPSWPDWIPPDDLLARLWLEQGLIAPPEGLTVLDEWEAHAADHLDTIDGDRLASFCLRIRLRHGVLDASVAERWEALDSYLPDRVPTCTAHDLAPPLFVSIAEAWLSAGEPERALALLDRRSRDALATREDEATIRHADAERIRIARRLRLDDQLPLLRRLANPSDSDPARMDLRTEAWRALAVVHHEFPTYLVTAVDSPPRWHEWWQFQTDAREVVMPGQGWQPGGHPEYLADIRADFEEIWRLRRSVPAEIERWVAMTRPVGPPVRSAEPYRDMRAALRLAALRSEAFTSRPGVPPRALAEMAFEEAELTALRLPEVASRLFGLAADYSGQAGDRTGQLLALAAVRDGIDAAMAAVRERNPELAAKLSGAPEDAGPWRYWAEQLQGRRPGTQSALAPGSRATSTSSAPPQPAPYAPPSGYQQGAGYAPPSPQIPAGSMLPPGAGPRRRRGTARRTVLLAASAVLVVVLGALAVALSTSSRYPHASPSSNPTTGTSATSTTTIGSSATASPRPPTSTAAQSPTATGTPSVTGSPTAHPGSAGASDLLFLWIGLAAGVVILVGGMLAWRIPPLRRLAHGRGVGAARLGALVFAASSASPPSVSLGVSTRPWRTAPLAAKVRLSFLAPGVWLVSRLRPGTAPYSGELGETALIEWQSARPAANRRWWRRGRASALGLLLFGMDPVLPWGRILSAGLGPDAAGRIEWIRLFRREAAQQEDAPRAQPAAPYQPQTVLQAPQGWASNLGSQYSQASAPATPTYSEATDNVQVQHVIGRAVATSAGPVMEVSGQLLTETDLRNGQPQLIVLQAEPIDGDVGSDPPPDQAEKLQLGALLIESRVPAVLLLPVLPASIAQDISSLITRHANARRPADFQRLLTRVRAVIAPRVAPQVLDDIALFLSEQYYRH